MRSTCRARTQKLEPKQGVNKGLGFHRGGATDATERALLEQVERCVDLPDQERVALADRVGNEAWSFCGEHTGSGK